jgi:hypothetical protein
MAREQLQQQERELCLAYEEVSVLEDDLRRISVPSVKRLRKPSLVSYFLSYLTTPVRGRREAAGSTAAARRMSADSALVKKEVAYNRTLGLLRENITALTLCTISPQHTHNLFNNALISTVALESKELLLAELAEALGDSREEAEER